MSNPYSTAAAALSARFSHPVFEELQLKRRDRLVSALLADRSVLRIISAPHGFGKSCLAYEYARRLFANARIEWVEASSPEFLHALDEGRFLPVVHAEDAPGLIVLDDLAFLDEARAQTLSKHIERQLYQGTEVIVTTIPSNDCLRELQPDRILVSAADLLVTERECRSAPDGAADERVKAYDTWVYAVGTLFGTTPSAIWGSFAIAQERCLKGFFSERLPVAMLRAAFGMMLMGEGDFDDLARLGVRLSSEEEAMLIADYPFLGIDARQRTFSVPEFSFEVLYQAVAGSWAADALVGGLRPLPAAAVPLCLAQGDVRRVGELLAHFFSDEQCAGWLIEGGWELLDRGGMPLVDSLLARTPPKALKDKPELMAVKAWCSGLMGSSREAVHYAQRAMREPVEEGCDPDATDRAGLMAYLALLLFGRIASPLYGKRAFALGTIDTPMDFLAAAVDACTEAEVVRAFTAWRDECDSQEREDCGSERADALVALFTQYEERFSDTPEYRLALHLLQFVDNGELRKLLHQLGTSVVVEARRRKISYFTEAVLVSDLWRGGFFGVSARSADLRDARVLDGAAGLLEQLGVALGGEPLTVPWEQSPSAVAKTGGVPGRLQRNPQLADRFPVLKVRTFGGIEITMGDQPLPESKFRRKALLLLVILVIQQGRDVSKDFLLGELWPELDRSHALDNFYTNWSKLMEYFGNAPYLVRTEGFCRADCRFIDSDVAEFEQLSRRLLTGQDSAAALMDIYARLEALYKGELMPAERKSPFILAQRERFRTMLVDAMVAGTEQALSMRDMRVALWFARKAKEEDPHREDVYQTLIKAQVAAGQRCSAIRTFFECKEFLNTDLGLDPSVEVQELYDQLITVDPSLLKLEPSSFK